jgi:putative ABC transport system substrate-binding protein
MFKRGFLNLAKRMALGAALITAAAGGLLLSDWNQRAGQAAHVAQVAVFQFDSVPTLEDGARGLLDGLRRKGYIEGRNIHLERFNAHDDIPTANAIARQLVSGKYDYIFSISTNCLQVVANANRDGRVKHIFGIVADPIIANVGVTAGNPLNHPKHMVGVGTLMPVDDILIAARQFNPRVKRFGMPWNPAQANSVKYAQMARAATKAMGFELLEGAVENSTMVGQVTGSLVSRGADAILVLGDLTVAVAIDSVVAEARKGRIPVFSVLTDTVRHGVMYAAGSDFYQVGGQMADMGARVMDGEEIATIPVVYDVPKSYVVNLLALDGLKDTWRVPEDAIAKANLVIDQSGTHKK